MVLCKAVSSLAMGLEQLVSFTLCSSGDEPAE